MQIKSLMKYSFIAFEKGEYDKKNEDEDNITGGLRGGLWEVLGEVLHEVLKMLNR